MSPDHQQDLKPQVPREHYFSGDYLTPERFASYGYQIQEVLRLAPRNVLEIGIGNGVVAYTLKQAGLSVTTLDFDESLHPDIVASVTDMPLADESYDVVACFEVLEHIPWELCPRALAEIHRVCRAKAIISLPDTGGYFCLHIPKLLPRRLCRRPFWKPMAHQFDGQHYWAVNKKGFPLAQVMDRMTAAGFQVEHTFRPWEYPVNRFFRLRRATPERKTLGRG